MDSASDYLEITLERVLSIWWSFAWRCAVFAALTGAVLGFMGGFVVGLAGHPELGGAVGALLGWLAGIPVSIAVLGVVLRKRYSGFSIKLIRSTN